MSQEELTLQDERAYVCRFCSAVLPGWDPSDKHCDPTPPRGTLHPEVKEGCQCTENA